MYNHWSHRQARSGRAHRCGIDKAGGLMTRGVLLDTRGETGIAIRDLGIDIVESLVPCEPPEDGAGVGLIVSLPPPNTFGVTSRSSRF